MGADSQSAKDQKKKKTGVGADSQSAGTTKKKKKLGFVKVDLEELILL